MIFTLDQRLFQEGVLSQVRGLRFVLAADERRHVLLTDPPWDPEDNGQPVQRWLASLSGEVQDAVEKTLERGLDEVANMGASIARVFVEQIKQSQWEDGVLSPEDALRLMQTPLWLVLENGRNDLQFLRRVLEKKERDVLDEHLAAGRVEVPLGGGTGELKIFLENLATLPAAPSISQETTSWVRRLRSWVMFDRDARSDDPRLPSEPSETLREQCAAMTRPRPFPGHQLGRRTIENYLPFEALRAWAGAGDGAERTLRRQRVEAFESGDFGEHRRACFAMKDGLMKDVAQGVRDEFKQRRIRLRKLKPRSMPEAKLPATPQRKLKARERWLDESDLPEIFQGLKNPELRRRLNHGFGPKIAELYSSKVDDIWFHRVFDEGCGPRPEPTFYLMQP
jgi:hypothetical protein